MARRRNSKTVDFIKKYRLGFAIATAATYAIAMVLIVIVFPDVSNLWVSMFVLVSGFTASVTALGDLLVNAEDNSNEEQR